MRRSGGVLGIVALAAGSLVVLAGSPAGATTVTDEASFRAAWTNAAETQIDLANDITFSSPCVAASRNSTTPLVVNGNGHTLTLCTSPTAVLVQGGAGALTFRNITVTGATVIGTSPGAALLSVASVTVTGSTFSNHRLDAGTGGTAINSFASVSVTDSTFTNNSTSSGAGGAISATGSVSVTNSTFTNNRIDPAGGGSAGAIIAGQAVVVVNSTLTGNSASQNAGAIFAGSSLTAVYSTFTGNTSATGSALVANTIQLFGTVLQTPGGTGSLCFFGASATSSGYNYANETANSCNLVATGDSSLDSNNPQLGALASNGGPTQTQLPATGSPLIDAIPNAACSGGNTLAGAAVTTDQRALARPEQTGGSCDIGAVEVQLPVAVPVVVTPRFTG